MISFEISEEFERLANQCFDKWGFTQQLLVLIEEFGELIKTLVHVERKNRNPSKFVIMDEFADSFIMLMGFMAYLQITNNDLKPFIKVKLDRLRNKYLEAKK